MNRHPTLLVSLATLTLLASGGCSMARTLQPDTPSIAAPAMMQFGASLDTMRAAFDAACETYDVRELSPADLPIATTSHVQVDCRGFDHAGAVRLAEFVFADDALAFVWVLTDASEETVLRAALEASFGTPTHDADAIIAFADSHTALRRDVPELLYYSPDIADMYRAFFDQMAAQ
tara:strand:- start:7619 stop:8146 length:528 start_codon:yes stop_codon:yes gene_type:complete